MWHGHGDGGSRGSKKPTELNVHTIYISTDIPIIRWKGIFTLEKERSEVA